MYSPESVIQHDAHYNADQYNIDGSLHKALEAVGFISLDSDKRDFTLKLWDEGLVLAPLKESLPLWLSEPFEKAKWCEMSHLCDWADGMFTINEFHVEVYKCRSLNGTESYRLLATVDADTYIHIKGCMVTSSDMVTAYIENVVPRLENLLAAL